MLRDFWDLLLVAGSSCSVVSQEMPDAGPADTAAMTCAVLTLANGALTPGSPCAARTPECLACGYGRDATRLLS